MNRRTAQAALAVTMGALLAHALWLAVVAEDAYISFRYARNLLAGAGLVWNPGEAPVEGYTNFLWVLVSALFQALGVAPGVGAQVVGTLSAAALLPVLYVFARRLGWSRPEALLPVFFLALAGPFAAWASSGLETDFFTACVWGGFAAVAAYADAGRARAAWLGAAALLLATLTRPEGVLALGLALVFAAGAARARPPAWRRGLARPLGLACGLFGLYFAWRWSYFGQPLPNTFHAKTGASFAQLERGAAYALYFARDFLLPWLPLLALAALAGRPAPGSTALAAPAVWHTSGLALATGFCAAWLVYVVAIGGDYMAMYRFFVPALPGLYLLLAAAARRALAPGPRRAWAFGALGLAAVGTLLHSTPLEARLLPAPERMHGNWRGIQTERREVARLSAIGRAFAAHGAPGESLGTDAIGAIGWTSGLDVYGIHGLVDPAIARAPRRSPDVGGGWAGHDRRDLARLFQRRPTFVMFSRELRPQRPRGAELQADLDPRLVAEYGLAALWIEDFANNESGWLGFLERRDRAPAGAGESGH